MAKTQIGLGPIYMAILTRVTKTFNHLTTRTRSVYEFNTHYKRITNVVCTCRSLTKANSETGVNLSGIVGGVA